jgi:hypothetical protein
LPQAIREQFEKEKEQAKEMEEQQKMAIQGADQVMGQLPVEDQQYLQQNPQILEGM